MRGRGAFREKGAMRELASGQGRGGEGAAGDSKGVGRGTFSWFPMILRAASMRAGKGWSAATPLATKKVVGVTLSSCTFNSKQQGK